MAYERILIGTLTNSNLDEYRALEVKPNEQVLLFSRLDLPKLAKEAIMALEKPFLVICPTKDIRDVMLSYKYDYDMVPITNWFLAQGQKTFISLRNGAKLYASLNLNMAKYDGNRGYGITLHNDNIDIRYHGYGVSINSIGDGLIQWVFDGLCIKRHIE